MTEPLQVGDIVYIHRGRDDTGRRVRWNGTRAVIREIIGGHRALLVPIDPRPDGYMGPYYWPVSELRKEEDQDDQPQ